MERELDPPAHPWRIPTTVARTNYAPAPSAEDPLLEPVDPQVEEEGRESREHEIHSRERHVRSRRQGGAKALAHVDERIDQHQELQPREPAHLDRPEGGPGVVDAPEERQR